jgi:Na+/H+-dicarboxylate symporter
MARISYHINSFITEIIGFAMIVFAAFTVGRLKGAPEVALFRQLILLLTLDTIIVVFGVYPAILYFYAGNKNPYKWLFAVLAPAIAGLVSGDSFLSLGLLIRHGRENLGIPRKVGATTFPFFAIFGKAGTAMVSSLAFLMILRSYSSLGIGLFTLFWILFAGFIVSVTASSVPGMGAFVALSLMCSMYGRGIEEGFLILKPVAPLIICIGTFIDILNNAFASFIIAQKENMLKEVDIKDYI